MRKEGIIFFATEEAKRNYKKVKKVNKSSCPSCEIKNIKPTNYIKEEIKEEILIGVIK